MQVRIKEVMSEKGMTSVALAEKIGVSKVTISNLINAKTMPSIETIEKVAEALSVPVWQLFASPEEVNPSHNGSSFKCPKCGTTLEIKEKK